MVLTGLTGLTVLTGLTGLTGLTVDVVDFIDEVDLCRQSYVPWIVDTMKTHVSRSLV